MATRCSTLSTALASLCVLLAATGCSTPPPADGFAIYLTRHNVAPSDMEMLSHVEVADQPIVSMDDVLHYDASAHDLTLTFAAYERLATMDVPVSGTSFVACVDGDPIYWGAFWTPVSSLSFDGVTIWKPLSGEGSPVVQIRMGYPGQMTDEIEDPRNDPAVLAAFQRAGKLIVRPPTLPAGALPQSFKGYELYSWQEGTEWHFTLITGTNRNKTAEEILSPEPRVTAPGWVRVHASGVDQIKAVLSRLPEAEQVIWRSELHEQGGAAVALPPQTVIDDIALHAAQSGVSLSIALP